MTLHLIDTVRQKNIYHMDLLKKNIKRYQKICLSVKFTILTDEISKLYQIIDIYTRLDTEYDIAFSSVELCVVYNDISFFIDYSIKTKKDSIMDDLIKLNKDILFDYINNLYDVKLSLKDKIKGKKIIRLINDKK